MEKRCNTCNTTKPVNLFFRKNRSPSNMLSGYSSNCKDCCKSKIKPWNDSNKEKISRNKKRYYLENKEDILKKREIYRKDNPEKCKECNSRWRKNNIKDYDKRRSKEDVQYKLRKVLRHRLYSALKGRQKVGSAVRDLGCSIEQLKVYLESKFKPGMSWDNWTIDGWHIDHIVPLSFFDLTNREELLIACNYTNLQPLWANDNLSKGGVRNVRESSISNS